jgi:hypothetical protein
MGLVRAVHHLQCRVNGKLTRPSGFVGYLSTANRETPSLMRKNDALSFGLIGYLYRWLRDGGIITIATGLYLIGPLAYHALQNGRTEARVVRLEIACVAERKWYDFSNFSQTLCSNREVSQAPTAAGDVAFAVLAFKSDIGAEYVARLKLDDLHRPNLQRDDRVGITYARDNPNLVGAVPTLASFAEGGWLIASGVLMLALVALARRAARYRGDVEEEVAALEAEYARRVHPGPAPARVTRRA